MKRKHGRIALAILTVSLCLFASVSDWSACCAQDLQTASTQQTKFYGQWSPPGESEAPGIDATRERFRKLFPPTVQPQTQAPPTERLAERYPLPQKPAPITNEIENARPLQPIGRNGMLQGSFLQPSNSGGDSAHVNHHEASTAEAVMPLPKPGRLSSWPSDAPKMDHLVPDVSESSLTGMVDSMQSSGKELWSQFQSEGGWGEKIAGFLGGGETGRYGKVFGSLAVIIGGYLAFVALLRKFNLGGNRGIPSEVIEVVGSAPFGPKKSLQLVRLGSKLLLLMNGPEGTHPVGEVTDPEEVDYLVSLCSGKKKRATQSVMSAVRQIGQRTSAAPRASGRTLHPASPPPAEATFSASQLVEALEAIKSSSRPGTVFEA